MSRIDRGLLDETLSTMYASIKYKENYLFYAHMIGRCSIKIDHTLPSPAGVAFITDHYNLYINPDEFDKYTLENRLAILKHEMLHILNNHILRTEDREHLPWNYSTDCAINQFISEEHLPKDGVMPKNFPVENCPLKQTAETYYELLKKEINKCKNPGDSEIENSEGQLLGDHESWSKSIGDKDLHKDITKKMIDNATTETIKSKGKIPSEINEWVNLFTRKSELDWRHVLRRIVGNKKVNKRTTIFRRDKRFPDRSDLRGKVKDRSFNLLIVCDVSGSMENKALIELLSEIKNICDITKTNLDLIQIDTIASNPEKINKSTKIFTRKSNGGTNLFPAIEKAKESNINFDAVIVATDGELFKKDIENFSNLNKPVIWLIEKTGSILPEMNSRKMQAFKLKK